MSLLTIVAEKLRLPLNRYALRFIVSALLIAAFAVHSPSPALTSAAVMGPVATVSAANYEASVAPDSIAAAFGVGLAVRTEAATATPLPTTLAGTTVRVNGRLAPLFFVSAGQVNFLLPAEIAPGEADVLITAGNGATSTGKVTVAKIAPALFTANAAGTGLPAAVVWRLRNGVQTTEVLARFEPSLNRFVAVPVDLGAESEQVFLLLFGGGVRGRTNLADVTVRLGGANVAVSFAGAQGGFAGLDQINIGPLNQGALRNQLLGRGSVGLLLTARDGQSLRLSNPTELEIAGQKAIPGSALKVDEPGQTPQIAGQTVTITGKGFSTGKLSDNGVKVGGVAAQVLTATTERLTVQLPPGVQTGKISVATPGGGEATTANFLRIGTSISGRIETTDRQAVAGVTVKVIGTNEQTTTKADGSFVLPLPSADANPNAAAFAANLDIGGRLIGNLADFGKLSGKANGATKGDNKLPTALALQPPNGKSIPTQSLTSGETEQRLLADQTVSITVFPCADGAPDTTTAETVTFKLEMGARVQYPADANAGRLTLTQLQDCRTPVRLPNRVFSSRIVQLTPLGATINPGGQLLFPNSDNREPGTQFRLYRLDQQPNSLTLGQFIDAGAATVSADRQRIETAARAITETGIFFVAIPSVTETAVVGRVVERTAGNAIDTPVQGALVAVRGQSTFTDGDGAFILRGVPVKALNDRLLLEASRQNAAGTSERVQRTVASVAAGVTAITPDLVLFTAAVNRAPTAVAQTVATLEDTPRVITLAATDPDGNPLRFIFTNPAHGTLAGTPPTLLYTPAADYNGADSFTFRVNDGTTDSPSATVSITVGPVNDPPRADPQSVTTPEDTPKQITLTGVDPDNNPMVYTIVTPPQRGTLTGTGATRTYTPATNFNGADSFTFRVNDGTLDSAPATVSITVTPVNDAPVITVPGAQTVTAGANLKFTVSATDVDAGQTLTFTAANLPTGATFTAAARQFDWTPGGSLSGNFTVSFTATDNGTPVLSDTEPVVITVRSGNRAPVANAQAVTTNEDTPRQITLTGSDPDNNPLTYSIVANPTRGTLSGTGATRTYTPTANYNGADSFTFKVNDGTLDSPPATVSITVASVCDAPVLTVPGAQSVTVGQALNFAVSAAGPDGPITLSVVNPPTGSSFNAANGQFSWTPTAAQAGSVTVNFTARTCTPPLTDTKSVVITVRAGIGTVNGVVRNAATGQRLAGATVAVAATSLSTTSAADGSYTLSNVPAGAQMLNASATGFTATQVSVNVVAGQTVTVNLSLSPVIPTGQLRITLNWTKDANSQPNDLDAHLYVPLSTGQCTEIFYINRGSLTVSPFAMLEVDNIALPEAPPTETIRISQTAAGTYRFFVHNFGTSSNTSLGASRATVQVFSSTTLLASFTVPTGAGIYWHVFDLNGTTRAVTNVNRLSDSRPASPCGSALLPPPELRTVSKEELYRSRLR